MRFEAGRTAAEKAAADEDREKLRLARSVKELTELVRFNRRDNQVKKGFDDLEKSDNLSFSVQGSSGLPSPRCPSLTQMRLILGAWRST